MRQKVPKGQKDNIEIMRGKDSTMINSMKKFLLESKKQWACLAMQTGLIYILINCLGIGNFCTKVVYQVLCQSCSYPMTGSSFRVTI